MRPARFRFLPISTHAPAGGATIRRRYNRCPPRHFYSRPCGRGDGYQHQGIGNQPGFLLTPLREGRLIATPNAAVLATISTHAPAGGATNYGRSAEYGKIISTHAPAGGATNASYGARMAFLFLLTPLREGRRLGMEEVPCVVTISTHAPAGGATDYDHLANCGKLIFLLTPLREGRRLCTVTNAAKRSTFLLTPLREGRLAFSKGEKGWWQISTHAPAGGATKMGIKCRKQWMAISTHAPAGGATYSGINGLLRGHIFLLTPLREGRRYCLAEEKRIV